MGWSGVIYSAANQAAQAVSVALATAYTGIGIYNPPGSGVNLVPLKVKFGLSVAPAAVATIGLLGCWAATGAVTAQTANGADGSSLHGRALGRGSRRIPWHRGAHRCDWPGFDFLG
ncbi:MAG: hypothetical protein AUG84_00790 [Chloroflexi bacterium 13_1_20CM_4_66_7]|nr:MAG: hypothetical protein AUG84_00790 [Chloroflexi bacterium 13_1_20CM_4_66_7]